MMLFYIMIFGLGAFVGMFLMALMAINSEDDDERFNPTIAIDALYIKNTGGTWAAYVDGVKAAETTGTIDELMKILKERGYMV